MRVVTPPSEAVELVWFDPAFVPRIRRQPGWKEIMAQAKARPLDEDVPGDAPPEKRQEARDRREVLALLARGEPTDMRGIEAAISNAIGEDGAFNPPLVLVAGQLELPFDEVEELKATVAAVTPLMGGRCAVASRRGYSTEAAPDPVVERGVGDRGGADGEDQGGVRAGEPGGAGDVFGAEHGANALTPARIPKADCAGKAVHSGGT